MALDTAGFQDAIRALLDTDQPDFAAAGDAWAGVYDDYCAGAVFGASTPVLTGKRAAMAATLAGAFASGVAATTAAAFSSAVATYWTAVVVAGAQAGVCASCPGAGAITAALAALAPGPNSKDAFAAAMATALDTATRTCTAAVAPPPGTVLPIG